MHDAPGHGAPRPGAGDEVRTRTRTGAALRVGPMVAADVDALFTLFEQVVAAREGYPHAPPLTRAGFDATWTAPGTATVVARLERPPGPEVVGAYYLRPNFVGRAAHIANAGYVVGAPWRRGGIGRLLVEDSVRRAVALGFDAVQFNLVFASNPARRLYEELGWRVIGRVPDAVDGEDALVYWRRVG
jgi:GNAT superfamily N-acetyltransferase